MKFLIIDDSPGRYEEFTMMLDKMLSSWVISFDFEVVKTLLNNIKFDAILLDHDMPVKDGREWAKWISEQKLEIPVVITSTTRLPDAKKEMLETFRSNNIVSEIISADHMNCEYEWYWWVKGIFDHKQKNIINGDSDAG
jgi:DNA-binding response OmpR family regulator